MEQNSAIKNVMAIDQQLRKLIPDYYNALKAMDDTEKAVELLAEHASIMIEMINELKQQG